MNYVAVTIGATLSLAYLLASGLALAEPDCRAFIELRRAMARRVEADEARAGRLAAAECRGDLPRSYALRQGSGEARIYASGL